MKKMFATLLLMGVAIILNAAPALALTDPFSDTTDHEDAILYLADRGVIGGYPDGTVRPDVDIMRGEVTKILVEGNGVTPDPEEYNNCFDDVTTEWFAPYVCYAQEEGWVEGYGDGTFKPGKTVVRAEVIKLILASQGYDFPEDDFDLPYTDVELDQWYVPYLQVAYDANLVMERGPHFNAGDEMNRGDAFETMFRTLVIEELGTDVYVKKDTDSIFGRDKVSGVRVHLAHDGIRVLWDEFTGGDFDDYAVFIKRGSDINSGDLAVGIDPIWVDDSTTFADSGRPLEEGTYYIKVGAGAEGEGHGFYSETLTATLEHESCIYEFDNFDPNSGTDMDWGDDQEFQWNGPGCSAYEFDHYSLCLSNDDVSNEAVCFVAESNNYTLTDEDWDEIEDNMTIEQDADTLNLRWFVQSHFSEGMNTQTLVSVPWDADPWTIIVNL